MGVIGDMIMAISSEDIRPTPNNPIVPEDTVPTTNLVGFTGPVGPRKEEMRQLLSSIGITPEAFPGSVVDTRFNARLTLLVSDVLDTISTFKVEKTVVGKLSTEGSEAQVISTRPISSENADSTTWINGYVQPRTVSHTGIAIIGASYFAGYQLEKEAKGYVQRQSVLRTRGASITLDNS